MHRSTNRDFYDSKLANAKGDPKRTLQLLQQSPHRKHKRKLLRVMELGRIMQERMEAEKGEVKEEAVEV